MRTVVTGASAGEGSATGSWGRLTGRPPQLTAEVVRACASNAEVSREKAGRELGFSLRDPVGSHRDALAWYSSEGLLAARPHAAA